MLCNWIRSGVTSSATGAKCSQCVYDIEHVSAAASAE